MSPVEHYQVAIVGGGVAGVTLALLFEKLGVNYCLFEAHKSLAPDQGASVGLLPNGLRILDQLGMLEEVELQTAALKSWRHIDANGELLSSVQALGYYPEKIGYGALFLERRKLLEIMSSHLKNTKSINTSTRVASLCEGEDLVTVTTSDGLVVTADLVIGADGVRSCVRDYIDISHSEKKISSDEYMSTRFACVYGISPPITGISEGDCFSVYRPEATILGFTGKDGIVFWFVFEDLGQSYPLSGSPRYVAADVESVCQSVAHLKVAPTITFGQLYATRTVAMKIALEEGLAEAWHTSRTVIVGDAAHKMVPNAAMGANQAIESSAVLVNELVKALKTNPGERLSRSALELALTRYAEQREPRTGVVMQKAGMACRAQLCHSGPAAAMLKELPSLSDGDWLFRGFMGFSSAPVVDEIDLSTKGSFYKDSVDSFWQKVKARESGFFKGSNSVLMGIECNSA